MNSLNVLKILAANRAGIIQDAGLHGVNAAGVVAGQIGPAAVDKSRGQRHGSQQAAQHRQIGKPIRGNPARRLRASPPVRNRPGERRRADDPD